MALLALGLGVSNTEWAADSPVPQLIPQPVRLATRPGAFVLNSDTVISADGGARGEAEKLAVALRIPTGLALPLVAGERATNCLRLELAGKPATELEREGYTLSVTPDHVLLRAPSEAGLFYAGVTLRQLLPPSVYLTAAAGGQVTLDAWSGPGVEIQDQPRFGWRGLLIDVARHYMPVEFLKKAVDLLALHKMNTLQLHLTDDQGWRLEIRKYPRLTEIGSARKESPRKGDRDRGDGTPYGPRFYTQAEMRDLVAYAAARHVTVVPEIEMPGHFLAALAAYPEFSCTGGPFEVRTRWGVEADILCAGNDRTFGLVEDILAEVTELFPSRFIHIGGDEAPRDRWKVCPKCQARIRAEGLKNEAELQTYFNRRIESFLSSKHRRLIGWDEILEGGLTPGAAVMSWRGISGGIAAARAGHDVVMSPTTHCYFDYAQSRDAGEPESIGGYIPLEMVYAFEPVPQELPLDKRQHILGGQGNVWTEYLAEPRDVEYFAFPRATALAEVLWSPSEKRDLSDFRRRLGHHQKRLDQWRVHYRKWDAAGSGGQ